MNAFLVSNLTLNRHTKHKLFISILSAILCILPLSSLQASTSVYDPLTSLQDIDNAERARGWQANWRLSNTELTERTRHTLYLEVSHYAPIDQVIHVEHVAERDLLFEQISNFWQYGRTQLNGRTLATATLKFDLYPTRAGNYILPSVELRVGSGESSFTFRSQPLTVDVLALPVASRGKLVAPNVTIAQSVSDNTLTAGGALTRTISVDVDDLPGHYIAELPFITQVEGVEVRTGNTRTRSDAFRGNLIGTRTTDIHYRFPMAGDFTLPAMTFDWWDTQTNMLKHIELAPIQVTVTPAPPLPWAQRVDIAIGNLKQALLAHRHTLVIVLLALAAVARTRSTLQRHLNQLKQRIVAIQHHAYCQQIKTIIRIMVYPQKKLSTYLYRYFAEIGVYDLVHHQALQAAIYHSQQGELRFKRCILARKMLRHLKSQTLSRYRLRELNTSSAPKVPPIN
ncbi:BatD family protein [Vibrio sp. McD22-P3]|uniref:BatD family protein n=1 Tax=Vibrio sp. McD22-P3 TaxID=2724880 RepID=UPI001F48C6C5|nr:BatD family protein [Vibrio sp. McD22-P3]MCF4176834.1 BatD family protein [Vibrio sp. McD22-P3]